MKSLKLGTDGDLLLELNSLVLIDGKDYVEQKIRENLLTFLGEVFTDLSLGVPYFQEIFQKGASLDQVEAIFKNAILNTPGVVELTYFKLDYESNERGFTVEYNVRASDGNISGSVTL